MTGSIGREDHKTVQRCRWCENPFSHPLSRESLPESGPVDFRFSSEMASSPLVTSWCENASMGGTAVSAVFRRLENRWCESRCASVQTVVGIAPTPSVPARRDSRVSPTVPWVLIRTARHSE